MEWISVEDRLSDPGRSILVLEDEGEIFVAQRHNDGTYIIDCRCYEGSFSTGVTHWMPLPNPPTDLGTKLPS